MKTLLGGSAALAATVLAGYVLLNTQPLLARTISLQPQTQIQQEKKEAKTEDKSAHAELTDEAKSDTTKETKTEPTNTPPAPAEAYSATAYSFRGRTASGRGVGKGIIAADTRVLPMGTRVRLDAGNWSGEYTVADTGGAIRGRKIDVWVPTTNEAFRFGRRKVKLTVLSYGGRQNKAKVKN